MSIDISTIKPGVKIRTSDGKLLTVRGSYMSSDGLLFTAKSDGKHITDRNIKASEVIEVIGG